jgi:hypothetical protein
MFYHILNIGHDHYYDDDDDYYYDYDVKTKQEGLLMCPSPTQVVMLPRSDWQIPQISTIFCRQKWLESNFNLRYPKYPLLSCLDMSLIIKILFYRNHFLILFKSSTICRTFCNPGLPRSPLFSCLLRLSNFGWND